MKRLSLLNLVLVAACADPAGDLDAEMRTAQQLLSEKKWDEAFAAFNTVASERDNALAQFTVGLFFRLGWGRPVDNTTAAVWFEKAAEGGIPAAQHFHAEFLVASGKNSANAKEAAVWFERAANNGHHGSWLSLSDLYLSGTGLPKDDAKAFGYARSAATHNVPRAEARIGRMLLQGQGTPKDPVAAWKWLERAAQRDDAEAQFHLGVMCRDGLGAPASIEAAERWFEKSAQRGYRKAYLAAGAVYLGDGEAPPEPEHLAKAYVWLSAAVQADKDPTQVARAQKLLDHALATMPHEWRPKLDEQVKQHLAAHADS